MRFLTIPQLAPGQTLAADLLDSKGHVLYNNGTLLTQSIIDELQALNFNGVYVGDRISDGIEPVLFISSQLKKKAMKALRDRDIDVIESIADEIINSVKAEKHPFLDRIDLRASDDYVYAHSVNVAVLCAVIGLSMKVPVFRMNALVSAALLHDLGMSSIPIEIVQKEDRLSHDEYLTMKTHPVRSFQMLKSNTSLPEDVRFAVLHHHENIDGSGYPDGLTDKQITLLPRILHVADVYDAMTAERPFKESYSCFEAAEYMMGGCGILFDKTVVEALSRHIPQYPLGSEVILSDGTPALVLRNTGVNSVRPVVRPIFDLSPYEPLPMAIDLSSPNHQDLTLRPARRLRDSQIRYAERTRNEMLKASKKYRIAAVDDLKTNLSILRDILGDYYNLALLKSGAQALTFLKHNPLPDLILMDIDMPEKDGIETTREIQELTNNTVPILFVTSHCDRQTVLACQKLNAAGYVVRPYNKVFLKSEIERILTGRII